MNEEQETYSRFAGIFVNRKKVAIVSGINREYSHEPGALCVDHWLECNGLSEQNIRRLGDSLPGCPVMTYLNCSDSIERHIKSIFSNEYRLAKKQLEPDNINQALDKAIFKVNADRPIITVSDASFKRRLANCPENITENPDAAILAFLTLCDGVFSRQKAEFRTTGSSIASQMNGLGGGSDWRGFGFSYGAGRSGY